MKILIAETNSYQKQIRYNKKIPNAVIMAYILSKIETNLNRTMVRKMYFRVNGRAF
jgi:hypothetical protein